MKDAKKMVRIFFHIYTIVTFVGYIVFFLGPIAYLLGGSSWITGLCALVEEGISTVFCGSGLVWMLIYPIAFLGVHYFGAARENYVPFVVLVVAEAVVTAAWCTAAAVVGGWKIAPLYFVSFALSALKAALAIYLMRKSKADMAAHDAEPVPAQAC